MFYLERALNGGWAVTKADPDNSRLVPPKVGAYTNTKDALAGLEKLMNEEDEHERTEC